MFLVSKVNLFFGENGFWSYIDHKTEAAIVSDFGRGGFGCVRGDAVTEL